MSDPFRDDREALLARCEALEHELERLRGEKAEPPDTDAPPPPPRKSPHASPSPAYARKIEQRRAELAAQVEKGLREAEDARNDPQARALLKDIQKESRGILGQSVAAGIGSVLLVLAIGYGLYRTTMVPEVRGTIVATGRRMGAWTEQPYGCNRPNGIRGVMLYGPHRVEYIEPADDEPMIIVHIPNGLHDFRFGKSSCTVLDGKVRRYYRGLLGSLKFDCTKDDQHIQGNVTFDCSL